MRRKPMQSGGGHRNNNNNNNNGGRPRKFRSNGHSGGGGSGGGGGGDYNSLARQKKHALMQKEKYLSQARDSLTNGDRVEAEYYYQHVEHYSRVVGEIMAKEAPRHQEHQQSETQFEDAPSDDAGNQNAADEADGNATEEDEEQHVAAKKPARTRTPRPAPKPAKKDDIPLPSSLFADTEEKVSAGNA